MAENQLIPPPTHIAFLKEKFGHDKFRDYQWEIINSIINNKRDSFLINATSSGKSLCYQYPAIYSNHITLVISPLISLMNDQVLELNKVDIKACIIGPNNIQVDNIADVFHHNYQIAYTTPEYMKRHRESILKYLKDKLILIAIDEAFCVTKWNDLRDFDHLRHIRETLPDIPILAVSAATKLETANTISELLMLNKPKIVYGSVDRRNIELEVKPLRLAIKKDDQRLSKYNLEDLVALLDDNSKRTIIICPKFEDLDPINELLKSEGISSCIYNNDPIYSNEYRLRIQKEFRNKRIRILLTTSAFSMGFDSPDDIKLIIHWGIGARNSLEFFCVQIGVAGRDGNPAKSILFYDPDNLNTFNDNLINYVNTSNCRRLHIREYFGEDTAKHLPVAPCCDNCTINEPHMNF